MFISKEGELKNPELPLVTPLVTWVLEVFVFKEVPIFKLLLGMVIIPYSIFDS